MLSSADHLLTQLDPALRMGHLDRSGSGKSNELICRCPVGEVPFAGAACAIEGALAPSLSSLVCVVTKSERRPAREVVAAYHEAQLAELLQRVGEAVDSFRAGELDAFDADQVIFQYSRAAKELWKFCNLGDVVFTARLISEEAPAAWWERGARNRP